MKVLVVCSFNSGAISSFITEQVDSLRRLGIVVDYYKVKGKGLFGYLKNLPGLRRALTEKDYDLVHAHYGLSGLLANLQRMVPVITTYHGSDTHFYGNRVLSYFTSKISSINIITNAQQQKQLKLKTGYSLIPCGIDTNLFKPLDKKRCREKIGFTNDENIILFSSSFDRPVKNPALAQKAVSLLDKNTRLVELKGYSRKEVVYLMNAADLILITSHYETGPLVVKEALACNSPIVSTDVGDVKELLTGLENCYLTSYDPNDISDKINQVLGSERITNGRKKVKKFELQKIAQNVKEVYQSVLDSTSI